MALFLDRIDSSPIANVGIDTQLLQWIWVLVDSLNENLRDIQDAFNIFNAPSYTAAQIISMESSGQLDNGIIIYDITNDLYVGRQNDVLTKFTTTAYP